MSVRLRLIKAYLYFLDKFDFLKSIGKKPRVPCNSGESQPQCILLLALFEKGRLRNDIEALIQSAKKLNFYIVGVNTMQLNSSVDLKNLFDLYIERSNYGRDFGSYKDGIMHLKRVALSLKNYNG